MNVQVFVMMMGLLFAGGEPNESNEPKLGKWDGFQDIKWGTDLRDVNDPNMVRIKGDYEKDITVYTRKTTKGMDFNGEPFTEIYYYCWRHKFFEVDITSYGYGQENFKWWVRVLRDYYSPKRGEGDLRRTYAVWCIVGPGRYFHPDEVVTMTILLEWFARTDQKDMYRIKFVHAVTLKRIRAARKEEAMEKRRKRTRERDS